MNDATELKVNLGQEFTISLEANPTTGYDWELEFDTSTLKLKEKNFESNFPATLGSSGEDNFVFLPIKTGKTEIIMLYKRPWENNSLKEKVFRIIVE